MSSIANIFEIPATNLDRAISFYSKVFEIPIEKMETPDMKMGLFPYEGQDTVGIIIQGEGYIPSSSGVTLYLNAGNDLQAALSKIEENGGSVLLAKTPHADGNGYFALFLDSEGNRLGLN
ncbi:VOC family protein [Chitinilyticum litopenaei]|uniref:VOC family protein n=1 Tax=Chitinilyticum litopenaei TaxID=1121276 RepID=UPI00048C1F0C|nr:VOC family protein [Chitinilyticum litopenaei]